MSISPSPSNEEDDRDTDEVSPTGIRMVHLRFLNCVAAIDQFLHGLVFWFIFPRELCFPVTVMYGRHASRDILHIPSAVLIATSFFISAMFHFIVVHPKIYPIYARGISSQTNYFRWAEYSMSSSLMIVLIAQFVGIYNVATLVSFFALNSSMIFFEWLQERYEFPGTGGLSAFYFGCFAGSIPWLVMGVYILTHPYGLPLFVYQIFVLMYFLFSCFAAVQYCQYNVIGIFRDYTVGEAAYIILSIVAKSSLALPTYLGMRKISSADTACTFEELK
jgi:hypothetical protein